MWEVKYVTSNVSKLTVVSSIRKTNLTPLSTSNSAYSSTGTYEIFVNCRSWRLLQQDGTTYNIDSVDFSCVLYLNVNMYSWFVNRFYR